MSHFLQENLSKISQVFPPLMSWDEDFRNRRLISDTLHEEQEAFWTTMLKWWLRLQRTLLTSLTDPPHLLPVGTVVWLLVCCFIPSGYKHFTFIGLRLFSQLFLGTNPQAKRVKKKTLRHVLVLISVDDSGRFLEWFNPGGQSETLWEPSDWLEANWGQKIEWNPS